MEGVGAYWIDEGEMVVDLVSAEVSLPAIRESASVLKGLPPKAAAWYGGALLGTVKQLCVIHSIAKFR